jgi:branched-chain amino acid transport system substrate-binding protein
MTTNPIRILAALLMLGAPLAIAHAAVPGITDTEVKLGMVNVQSGPAAGLGLGMRAGADAVFKEINAKGGIHGRKINLLVADDGYEPNRAVDETLKMIEQNQVFSLFGYVGTPTSNAVIPIVKEMNVPLVGAFTGAMTLRSPVTQEIFNVRASYDDEAEALVEHFVKAGAKSVAVFYQDDGFGLAVLSGTEKALKKRGMAVAAKGTFARNTVAIKTGLAVMLESKPDVVVMVGPYTPLAAFIKEARGTGLKSKLATVSFVGTDNLVTAVGGEGDGVVISQVVPFPGDNDVPVTRECRETLEKQGAGPLGFVNFEGCLTAKVMAAALERAGKDATRDGLIKALHGMSGVDIGGLKLAFQPDNHQALAQVFMTEIKGGRIARIR